MLSKTPTQSEISDNIERIKSRTERHKALSIYEILLSQYRRNSKERLNKDQWTKFVFYSRPRSASENMSAKQLSKIKVRDKSLDHPGNYKSVLSSKKEPRKYSEKQLSQNTKLFRDENDINYKGLFEKKNYDKILVKANNMYNQYSNLLKNNEQNFQNNKEVQNNKRRRRSRINRKSNKLGSIKSKTKVVTFNIDLSESLPCHFSKDDLDTIMKIKCLRDLETKVFLVFI